MFKRKKHQTPPQNQIQSFILEPILTPSGLIDVDDVSGTDIVDIPADIDNLQTDDFSLSSEPSGEEATVDQQNLAWAENGLETADFDPTLLKYDAGVFTVGETGEVGIDFLFDGGKFKGEVAIFSLEGMDNLEPGSEEFITEAATRATSETDWGHVVISDRTEGAKFEGSLGESKNWNSGDYQGVKTVSMRPGDRFGVMLVPNGTVQEVLNDPDIDGSNAPLFSLGTANPDDTLHFGQIADVTGDGNTFVMEDVQFDHNWYDEDYNDLIFQVRGAEGEAPSIDELIEQGVMDAEDDWREGDLGQAVVNYAEQYVDDTASEKTIPDVEQSKQPLVGVIDTGLSSENPDLDYDKITLGKDRVDGDDNPLLSAGEGNEHGTHVVGLIAAEQDNGIGTDGINDDAPLWVGRAVGSGKWAESLVEFVDAARESEQPNAVVNLSMDLTQMDAEGNVTTRYELTPGERAAIEYARQNNVLVVASSGNDNGVMSALGQASQEFDNLITVGAAQNLELDDGASVSESYTRADYSSYGYGLDLVAEGSTGQDGILLTTGEGTRPVIGSSVATAKVTGAASQVWAANPDLSFTQVKQILKDTATDLHTENWDTETGAGLLNIPAAVSLAKATKPEKHYSPSSLIPATWSGEGKVTPRERAVATEFAGKYYNWKPYTIQWGDTLSEIALNTMGSGTAPYYNFIAQKNGIADPNLIYTGNTIQIPYEVSNPSNGSGDSSSSVTNPILSQQGAGYFNARPEYYTSGNIFALSMYGSSLVGGRGYTEGNCTWYAHGRLLELGGDRAALQSMHGNANEWHYQISNGTQIASSPRPGDIAQWDSNHVAVVEKVNPDGTIVISESHYSTNWDGGGSGTLHNVRTISANSPDRFLRVPGVQVENDNSTPTPSGDTFKGRIIATIGANVRSGPSTNHSIVATRNYGETLTFDDVATGEFISYPSLGTATDQWYKIAGTNQWISAAIVNGSPESSLNAPAAKPGEQIQYIIKPGDTLWDIARRYLGDGRRWTEIQKADGSTFTSEEARYLQIGQSVYIPVEYEPDSEPEPQPGNPDIDIQTDFYGNFSSSARTAIERAVINWENVITKDKVESGVLKIAVTQGYKTMQGNAWSSWAEATWASYEHQKEVRHDLTTGDWAGDYPGEIRIHFNSNKINSLSQNLLTRLAMHEIGHALGLDEAQYDSSLGMNGIMDLKGLDPHITEGIYDRLEWMGYSVNRNASVNWG